VQANSLFDLNGRVIVVTGATGVLAGSAARYLQGQGASVVYLGRSPEKVESVVSSAREISEHCHGIVADVLDQNALEAARDEVIDRFGRVDALLNGAGGNMPGAVIGPDKAITDLSLKDFDSVLRLNLHGTVQPTLTFAPIFRRQHRGSIVNFSSMASPHAITRVVGYSAAKAAVDNFTRWLAVELASKYGDGIRVNAVAPGFFVSHQNRALLLNDDGTPTERGAKVLAKTPFHRFGEPEELHGALHYLVSDASRFVTGTVLAVDGGFLAYSGV
jgi:NAD(P)-dependent dehydrogenase (short-subunit alcohol dehydrogenase family)